VAGQDAGGRKLGVEVGAGAAVLQLARGAELLLLDRLALLDALEAVRGRAQAGARAGATAVLGSAADSLKRIKERQAIQDEKFKASAELEDRRTGADLDAKLQAAGILPGHASADDVLARLKAPAADAIQLEAPRLQIESQPVERDAKS